MCPGLQSQQNAFKSFQKWCGLMGLGCPKHGKIPCRIELHISNWKVLVCCQGNVKVKVAPKDLKFTLFSVFMLHAPRFSQVAMEIYWFTVGQSVKTGNLVYWTFHNSLRMLWFIKMVNDSEHRSFVNRLVLMLLSKFVSLRWFLLDF